MKEEPVIAPKLQNRSFSKVTSWRGSRMFGPAEIAAVAVSCLLLLLVLASYVYFLVPARSQRASLESDRKRLQENLTKLKEIVKTDQNTKQTVDKITTSLTDFENVSLMKADEGRMDLYGELNRLIVKNNLRNTSGPSYTPLQPVGEKVTPGTSVSTKWQSVYPGIGVLVTVEGSYQNLRQFIQDIEKTRQYVIVNQIELQRAENSSQLNPEQAAAAGSGTRGSIVSLQLNMSMYFKREEAVTTPSPTSQEH